MSGLPSSTTITRTVLENGIAVLVYENHAAQSVVINGSLMAGANQEAPMQNGLAALTASALMRGTHDRTFEALHEALEDNGADIGFSAGGHRTSFSGKALAEDLPLLIDILADTLRRPSFPDVQIERLRGQLLTGLRMRQQDTRYRAGRAFRETLYPEGHPYHYSVRGEPETVAALQPIAVKSFHRVHYQPRGMVIVVVGAVQADAAIEVVRQSLGDWVNEEQTDPIALPPIPPARTPRRIDVAMPGKSQVDIVMGAVGPARKAPDYWAAQLANSVLGQFAMMGRIGAVVREQLGLAYYAYSSVEGGTGPGAWSIAAGVNPANVELAIEKTIDEVRRLTLDGVTDEDLADNQAYYTGHLPLQLESNEGIAGVLHSIEIHDLSLDYLVQFPDMIRALTRDDLLRAAANYLNPDALVVAAAGTWPG